MTAKKGLDLSHVFTVAAFIVFGLPALIVGYFLATIYVCGFFGWAWAARHMHRLKPP